MTHVTLGTIFNHLTRANKPSLNLIKLQPTCNIKPKQQVQLQMHIQTKLIQIKLKRRLGIFYAITLHITLKLFRVA